MPENKGGLTLFRTEDWLAVWLGFLIIALVLAGVRPVLPGFRWSTDGSFAAAAAEQRGAVERLRADAAAKGEGDLANAASALASAIAAGDRTGTGAAARALVAAGGKAADPALKKRAEDAGRKIGGDAAAGLGRVFTAENLGYAAVLGLAYLVLAAVGVA